MLFFDPDFNCLNTQRYFLMKYSNLIMLKTCDNVHLKDSSSSNSINALYLERQVIVLSMIVDDSTFISMGKNLPSCLCSIPLTNVIRGRRSDLRFFIVAIEDF